MKEALKRLRRQFAECGYARSAPRRDHDPGTHRGYEVRFSAHDKRELTQIVRDLRSLGITPGRPFSKGSAYRIPIYGRDEVSHLIAILSAPAMNAAARARA